MHPCSSLRGTKPEWVVFHELVETRQIYIKEVTAIEANWLYKWLDQKELFFFEKSNQEARKTKIPKKQYRPF